MPDAWQPHRKKGEEWEEDRVLPEAEDAQRARSGLKAPDVLSGSGQAPDGDRIFLRHCKHGGDTDRFLSAAPDHQPLYRTAGRKSRKCGGTFKGLTIMACVYLLGVIANYLQSRLMLEVAQSALVRIRQTSLQRCRSFR